MTNPVWPDVSNPKLRKCPRHPKTWVTSNRIGTGTARYYRRYCPSCLLEQQQFASAEAKKHEETTGIPKVPLRIMTL